MTENEFVRQIRDTLASHPKWFEAALRAVIASGDEPEPHDDDDDTSRSKARRDVFVTTQQIPRTDVSRLPYGVVLTYTRVGDWSLGYTPVADQPFHTKAINLSKDGLRVDIDGHVIFDTIQEEPK